MTGEQQYLQLLKNVLENGVDIPDRTGVGSRAIFDAKIVYDEKEFPFSTIRPVPLRMAFEEFWFFMRGETQTKILEEKGINFWKGNTTREFLDNRGLTYLEEGDMGAGYGSQWRAYGETSTFMDTMAVDQLQETYNTLNKDPYSRRIYTTFWNPNESHLMALTPCWHSHQFVVIPDGNGSDVLHLKVLNRSLDAGFGFAFAAQQYRLYQMCMAKLLDMKVGGMSCDLTQVHLYSNQIEYTEELLSRDYNFSGDYDISRITIPSICSLEEMINLKWEDFTIDHPVVNKTPFVTPRPPMAA